MLLDHKELLNLIKEFLKNQIRKTGLVRVLEKEKEELIIQIKDSQMKLITLKFKLKIWMRKSSYLQRKKSR